MIWNQEPQRWVDLLYSLQYLFADMGIVDSMTWFADAFAFVWPLMLVGLYVSGMLWWRRWLKMSAVWIFLSAVFAAVLNVVIQSFSSKQRPDQLLDLWFNKQESLILYDFLPKGSFPSDHASVAFALATATLVWGLHRKQRWYVWLSGFLYLWAMVMSVARVGIGVHRPTDVLAWMVVGVFVGCVMLFGRGWIEKLVSRLVGIEEKIIDLFRR